MNLNLGWLSAILFAGSAVACGCESNEGNQMSEVLFSGGDREDVFVLECQMETADQRKILHELVVKYDLDLWSEGIPDVGLGFSLLLEEAQLPLAMDHFSCHKAKSLAQFRFEKISAMKPYLKSLLPIGGFFSNYQGYKEIMNELSKWVAADKKGLVKKFGSIGLSVEGRKIPVIHITANSTIVKPTLWLSGGQHAREWVAVSSTMYAIDNFLTGYGTDPEITRILDSFELVVAPIINPDGYEFSRTRDRLWRKNRNKNHDGSFGVDLNRNWDAHWGEIGASTMTRAQTYQGRAAHSEPEVRQTADYIRSLRDRAAGVDVHSFGQLVLRNYGWTVQATSQENYLKRLGDAIAGAMNARYQSDYKSQRSSALYPSGGSMDDWMFDGANMPGFTIELRDHGEFGFFLPPQFIIPTGEELTAGFLALAQQILIKREM